MEAKPVTKQIIHQGGKGELDARLIGLTRNGDVVGVKECLGMGANPNATCMAENRIYDGETALHIAAGNGDAEIVSLLLAAGASPDCVDGSGATPLFLAICHKRSPSLALTLLEAGAKPGTGHDAQGRTTIHFAVLHDSIPLLDMLIRHKADVNARTQMEFQTPLHYAAWNGYDNIIRRLLDGGASPDMSDVTDATPLHYAALQKLEKTCETLMEGGARADVAAQNGKPPAGVWDKVAEIAAGVSERQRARIIAENYARRKRFAALRPERPSL